MIKLIILLITIFPNTTSINAHTRGIYKNSTDAKEHSSQLGCEGIHKNGEYWMPCSNEKSIQFELTNIWLTVINHGTGISLYVYP